MKVLISALALVAALAGAVEGHRPGRLVAPRHGSHGGYSGYGGRGGLRARGGYRSGLGGYGSRGRAGYRAPSRKYSAPARRGYGAGLSRRSSYAAPSRRVGYGGRGGVRGYGGAAARRGGYGGRVGRAGYSRPGAYGAKTGYGAGLGYGAKPGYGVKPALNKRAGYGGHGGYGKGAYGHGGHGLAGGYGGPPVHKRAYKPAHGGPHEKAVLHSALRLDADTFRYTVLRDKKHVWVVAFIDPSCGNCKKFAIEWERLQTIETITYKKVRLGYVDVSDAGTRSIVGKYTAGKELVGVPKVFIYGEDKLHPAEVRGPLNQGTVLKQVHDVCEKDECKRKRQNAAVSRAAAHGYAANKFAPKATAVGGVGISYSNHSNLGATLDFDEFGQKENFGSLGSKNKLSLGNNAIWNKATSSIGGNDMLSEFGFGTDW